MSMRPFSGPLLAALGLALSGCATFMSPGVQVMTDVDEVNVSSEPPGASCRIERMAQPVAIIKETPATVTVPRSRYPIDIFCTKEGAAGAQTVWPGVNPFVYGDLLFGGVPYLVDSALDADRTLPETILITFPVTGQ
jgi:hypothetical protein